jgi:molybdopterin-biosynthesis enzyme MoeA-like protein
MNFYAVIIGTEILNGRREDKHFSFLREALAEYGHTLFASFVIKDDKELITRVFKMIKEDEKSVMFSFGGIGSTPDDLTREIASKVFRNAPLEVHSQFFKDIEEKFGKEAYPHRIHMADLPPKADLIYNPVNNMSGFALDNRYFFVPGFPSMAHPMLKSIIQKHFATKKENYRKTLIAKTSENTLISLMQQLPESIELSSLPMFKENKPHVELSLSSDNKQDVLEYFQKFENALKEKNIQYTIQKETI